MNSSFLYRLGWLCFSLIGLLGCDDGLARVEGRVTFNGEPVSRGMVNLEPVDGKGPVTGSPLEEGRYAIENVTPGEKIVRISAVYTVRVQRDASDGSEVEICDDLLPAEYGQASAHRLMVEAPTTTKDYAIEGRDPRSVKK